MTVTQAQTTPTSATYSAGWPGPGSGIRQASGRGRACMTARAPLPVHSSSITAASCTSAAGCRAGAAQGGHGRDHRGKAGLHVGRAAAVHAALADAGLEGRGGPEVGGALRNHVHMALQHQAAALGGQRAVQGHGRCRGRRRGPAAGTSRARTPARRRPPGRARGAGQARRRPTPSPQARQPPPPTGCGGAPGAPAAPCPRHAGCPRRPGWRGVRRGRGVSGRAWGLGAGGGDHRSRMCLRVRGMLRQWRPPSPSRSDASGCCPPDW